MQLSHSDDVQDLQVALLECATEFEIKVISSTSFPLASYGTFSILF